MGNQQFGISVSGGGLLAMNNVQFNGAANIVVGTGCRVSGNVSDGAPVGAAGGSILVIGSRNHIVDNSCTGGDLGIVVEGDGNIIERNRSSTSGADYTIASGNRYGPIVDIRSAATPAVLGSSAPGTMTSADPTANFSY